MKNALVIFLSTLFFTLTVTSYSQNHANNLSYRGVFDNFQFPFDKDLNDNYTFGIELGYTHAVSDQISFAFPLAINQADLPIDNRGRTQRRSIIGSLDGLLRINMLKPDYVFQPYVQFGYGFMMEFENGSTWNFEVPAGLGVNIRVTDMLYLSAESQYRVDYSDNRNHLRHAVGFVFLLEKQDADGDGIPDSKDDCPDTPGIEEFNGCPDTDNDGIMDKEDDCPNDAGLKEYNGCPDTDGDGIMDKEDDCPNDAGLKEYNGCPDTDGDGFPDPDDDCPDVPGIAELNGCPDLDKDDDGVNDDVDDCPDVAGPASTKGCPDRDSDGVADKDDKCPDTPGLPRYEGCPDTDGDGIADPTDKCPNSAGPASNNGCPELKKEEKEVLVVAMQAVQFETGSAVLKTDSYGILNQIADIMRKYSDQKLRISGHTDSIGSEDSNQSLSERRAKSCFDYLVSQGITGSRMVHAGFGESQPIADNKFSAGRQKNRRVEFEIFVD